MLRLNVWQYSQEKNVGEAFHEMADNERFKLSPGVGLRSAGLDSDVLRTPELG